MKIAILLTGQLRTIEYTKKILRDSFPGADFFLSIDMDNSQQNVYKNAVIETNKNHVEYIVKFFNPREFYSGSGLDDEWMQKFEKSFYFVSHHKKSKKYLTVEDYLLGNIFQENNSLLPKVILLKSFKKLFEQYFYLKKAIDLMINFEIENKFQYDLIIRLRFDQLIYTSQSIERLFERMKYTEENISFVNNDDFAISLDFSSLGRDEVVVFGWGHNNNYFIVNDQHFVAKRSVGIYISNIYESLAEIILDSIVKNLYPARRAHMEYFFAEYLKKRNIKLRSSSEFGYGGMFIRGV